MDIHGGTMVCFQDLQRWICVIQSKKKPILRSIIPYELEPLPNGWYAIYLNAPRFMLPKIDQKKFGWSLSFVPFYDADIPLKKTINQKLPHEGKVFFFKTKQQGVLYCMIPFSKKTRPVPCGTVMLNSAQGYAFKISKKMNIKKDQRFVYIPEKNLKKSDISSNDVSFGDIYNGLNDPSLPAGKRWPFYALFNQDMDTKATRYHLFYEAIRLVEMKKIDQALDILTSLMRSCHILPLDYRMMTHICNHLLKGDSFDVLRYVEGIDQTILKILIYRCMVHYHDHKNAALLLKSMNIYHGLQMEHIKNFIHGSGSFEEKKIFLKNYHHQPDVLKKCTQLLFNYEIQCQHYLEAGDFFYDYWVSQPASEERSTGLIQSCEALMNGQGHDKAITILSSVEPINGMVLYLMGVCYYHQHKYSKALDCLKESLLPNSFQNIGYIYFDQGQWKEARHYLEKRLNLIVGALLPDEIILKKNLILLIWCCDAHMNAIEKRHNFINQHKDFLKSHAQELSGLLTVGVHPSVAEVKQHLNNLKKTVTLLKVGRTYTSSGQVLIEAAKRPKGDATFFALAR